MKRPGRILATLGILMGLGCWGSPYPASAYAEPLRRIKVVAPWRGHPQPAPPFSWQMTSNYGPRDGAIDTIVLHCTTTKTPSPAVNWFMNPNSSASAHVVVPDQQETDHHTIRMVRDESAAWHVRGELPFQGRHYINGRSLGIEIVNTGQPDDHYSEQQVKLVASWCRHWMSRHPIRYIATHAYLDPTRRRDPCVTFPWEMFVANLYRPERIRTIVFGRPLPAANAQLYGGTVRVDLRPLAEHLGLTVQLDRKKSTVYVNAGH